MTEYQTSDSDRAQALLKQAVRSIVEGKFAEAIACLDESLKLNPAFYEAYFYRGMTRFSLGEYEGALLEFENAIRIQPAAAGAYCGFGSTLLTLDRDDEALIAYTHAIRLQPSYGKAYFNRGSVHERLGNKTAALEDYSATIRCETDQSEFFIYRGELHAKVGDAAEDFADFGAALASTDAKVMAHVQRGSLLIRLKRQAEALQDFDAAIRIRPEFGNAYLNRGIAHAGLENIGQALADYSQAIVCNPSDVDALSARGELYSYLNDECAALADFTRVLDIDPENPTALLNRGRIFAETGDLDRALADCNEVIRLQSDYAAAYCQRANLHEQREHDCAAIADFSAAISLDPGTIAAWKGRGRIHDVRGDFAAADDDFRQAEVLQLKKDESMAVQQTICSMLQSHFQPTSLDNLSITERQFPIRVRADLQRGIDSLLQYMTVAAFCGIHKKSIHQGVDFSSLVVRDRNDPAVSVPPQFEEIDIGEDQPIRCLKDGIWLLEDSGTRLALFLEPASQFVNRDRIRIQLATTNDAAGLQKSQLFLRRLELAIQESRSYRGKILSLEVMRQYSGTSTGIKVHKLRPVQRDQVILPRQTLELLERNVIQFVRERPNLLKLGMATKKGLLFYGPPGTGKTHTLQYLAGALPGMTTLLITAEQVGLLDEYITLARLLQPSMVVIEDADLIARNRERMDSPCEEVLLNKLLNEMDGLREDAEILFILTTNRPDAIEPALSNRPGRIDQAIEFPFPDQEGREKLIRLYCRGSDPSDAVVLETARRTDNVSAAFIKELMRRSAQFNLERGDESGISLEDVSSALEEMLFKGGALNRKLLGGKVED